MESRWLKARNNYRKILTLAVVAILLVLTIFSPIPTEAAELTATVKKYGDNWAVIYNPGEIYFAFEEVAKAELVPIDTINGTSYVVKVRDNRGADLPVTYAEAREYMQSKGYWQDEDLSEPQIEKQSTTQWWVIYPTTGQKLAFEAVAEIKLLSREVEDKYGNDLPITSDEAIAYMASKKKGDNKDDAHEEEEKGFWEFVKTKLEDIFQYIKDVAASVLSIGQLLATGNIFTAFVVGIVMTCKPWAGEISTLVFTLTDQTELLFSSDIGSFFTGFAEKFGFMLWIIGFIIATAEIVINHRSNRLVFDSVRDYAMNTFKSLLAVTFFTTIPVPLYSLFSKIAVNICYELGVLGNDQITAFDYSQIDLHLSGLFPGSSDTFCLIFLIAIIFSGLKVCFSFLKRGGILMILILVGSVHMINITRGYWDAFWSWCRQIIALCITHFCQMLLFCGGIAIFTESLKVTDLPLFFAGLGMFLAAAEVPRIADRFGMDTSLKGNAAGAIQTIAMVARKAITKGA